MSETCSSLLKIVLMIMSKKESIREIKKQAGREKKTYWIRTYK